MTLLYILSGIWVFLFFFISYGNYRWWKDGSNNNNLFWGPVIKLTFVTLLLLGGTISALVPQVLLRVESPAVYVHSFFAILLGVMIAALSVIIAAKIITFPCRYRIAKEKEYEVSVQEFCREEKLSPISEIFQSKGDT